MSSVCWYIFFYFIKIFKSSEQVCDADLYSQNVYTPVFCFSPQTTYLDGHSVIAHRELSELMQFPATC